MMNYKIAFPDGILYLEDDKITLEDLESALKFAQHSGLDVITIRTNCKVTEPGRY